ncbi:P-loop containing nucleoside triphosphate hydrolase protein [Cyathus striatus]|nr:P-loop containing nucleoside triphosphate hydrolase protein [Cyathus striatus]
MPRIRKKTSNRLKTHDRHKLQKKIKETKRKTARNAKKSVQWKSKTPKDPGIPNDFPYNDQILAEVAQQRRVAAEEKERKKEEKKAARIAATQPAKEQPGSDAEAPEGEDEDEPENLVPKGLNPGADAIASLSAKLIRGEFIERSKPQAAVSDDEDEEDEVPVLINRELPTLQSVLDKADVVIEVLDARDPLSFRSGFLEESLAAKGRKKGKKVVFVLNKIDAVPRESVTAWLNYLRTQTQNPTFAFRSASAFLPSRPETIVKKGKGKGVAPTDDAIGAEGLLSCLSDFAKTKGKGKELNVAVVGLTNAGKSSLINSLLHAPALEVYTVPAATVPTRTPSTTLLPQEATLSLPDGREVRFIDTPGLAFEYIPSHSEESDEEGEGAEEAEEEAEQGETPVQVRARDILTRCRGRIDRLKDPLPPVEHVLSRSNVEDLMLLYSLPMFEKGSPESFLISIARSQQLVRKKGRLDTNGAAKIVLRDWNVGKFARWSGGKDKKDETWYKDDEKVLCALQTRKEMRKGGVGLVKITPGQVEERKVTVEVPYEAEESDSEDEDAGCGDGDAEGDDDEEGDYETVDEDEEVDEATPPPPPTSNKQKRKRGAEAPPAAARPSKKAAEPVKAKEAKPKTEKKGVEKIRPSRKAPAAAAAEGAEAYDFGKFF